MGGPSLFQFRTTTRRIIIMVKVKTKPCIHCGQPGLIEMTGLTYSWGVSRLNQGAYIQEAFPSLSAEEREQIISGTHPACWNAIFGKEDEE
jgi:hypothetical protein